MKKVIKQLTFILIVCMMIGGLASCKGNKIEPYSIPIASLFQIEGNIGRQGPAGGFMNVDPFEDEWSDFPIFLPVFPEEFDWSSYNRIRVVVKYYFDDGEDINQMNEMEEHVQGNAKAAVSFIYDPDGDWRGPAEGPGPNTPVKEFNIGGTSSTIHLPEGAFCFIERDPKLVLFQNSHPDVAFIEVMEITFFNVE